MTQILWFRRDLRIVDNPALLAACAEGGSLVCVYVHAPDEESPWSPGAASRWWLHHSLHALSARLNAHGHPLRVMHEGSLQALRRLAESVGATDVHACAQVEPVARARDRALQAALLSCGITLHRHAPNLFNEPEGPRTAKGDPYRVFTPYWRQVRSTLVPRPPVVVEHWPRSASGATDGQSIDSLGLLPRIDWDSGLRDSWHPGEEGAFASLDAMLDGEVHRYAQARNRPDQDGTSRLSPHLHYGEITPHQVLWALASRGLEESGAAFIRELGWREFCHHLLWHFPHTSDEPLDVRFADYPWQEPPDPALLHAWQQGRTGLPMVDAGMRQLWHTGWMHNRVRMVVASLLTKNLRTHWLHGARWFWDTLVDADLANNSAGWQWTAGSGADAAPYFRIFNPVLQGQRFDPRGDYVRRWIPELAKLPAASIHAPWKLSAEQQREYGIAGTVYASPLVDLAATRAASLEGLVRMRKG